ncbi:actin cortical patch SUR7/pH-response regulator pali [Dichotomocladium elegans]|nr:actin cortical patch SUR7/pH-response regulator pali [Dichotomocladium elegans]
MSLLPFIATFFDFAALVLQVFTIIGNTYNRPFLRDLYFARLNVGNTFYDFGLWNYCSGQGNTVNQCTRPDPPFDWSTVSDVDIGLGNYSRVFLAVFILYFIGLGLTFFAMLITFMTGFRRGSDVLASIVTFIAAILMVVVWIILMVVSLRGLNNARNSGIDADGHLGPSMWMTLGAMVALLLSSFWYCITCFFPGRRVWNAKAEA